MSGAFSVKPQIVFVLKSLPFETLRGAVLTDTPRGLPGGQLPSLLFQRAVPAVEQRTAGIQHFGLCRDLESREYAAGCVQPGPRGRGPGRADAPVRRPLIPTAVRKILLKSEIPYKFYKKHQIPS